MSADQPFGRLQGRVYLKHNGKFYAISDVETSGTINGLQKQVITCIEIGSGTKTKLTLKGEGLIDPFVGAFEAEKETGCPSLLLIDLESGEWSVYLITDELKHRFPFLRDKID